MLCAAVPAYALEKTDDIDTNRPSFMFSPLVVPKGSIQSENGVLYSHFRHGGTIVDLPEDQLRFGLTKRLELQMFVPNAFLLQTAHQKFNGVASDINELGFKYQFPAIKKLQVTAIAGMNLPTGSVTVSGKGVVPVFRMPYSYSLGKWAIMGMQSILLINDGHNVDYEPDVMLSRSITPRTGVFAEYGGFFIHNSRPVNIAHFGGVWKLNRHNQVDIQFGFGMNKTAPAAFVGAGYSYRFDWLPYGNPVSSQEKTKTQGGTRQQSNSSQVPPSPSGSNSSVPPAGQSNQSSTSPPAGSTK